MVLRALVLLLGTLAAACATNKQMAKDQPDLAGHKSPYAFHRSMSYTFLRTGQPARAIPHIQRMLEHKDSAEGHYLLGRVHLTMGLFPQAKSELSRAIALDEKLAPAHAQMGVLLDSLGEHRKAEASHRRAIALNGKHASFRNNLGFCLYLQSRFTEALAAYREALQIDPSLTKILNNVGFTHAKLGDLRLAYKHFLLAGGEPMAQNNMGFVYERRGELEQAYDSYLKACRGDPSLIQARINLVRVCKALGRPAPALPESGAGKEKAKEKEP
jgi:Flp pilus assembly protein TadD